MFDDEKFNNGSFDIKQIKSTINSVKFSVHCKNANYLFFSMLSMNLLNR